MNIEIRNIWDNARVGQEAGHLGWVVSIPLAGGAIVDLTWAQFPSRIREGLGEGIQLICL